MSANHHRAICLVTGANAGIGLETARGLARTGAHVVLACRNREKADAAVASIAASVPGASLEVLVVDVASRASIAAATSDFLARHSRLDVLVNNAAIASPSRRETADHIELTWATNVLGYHAMTRSLLAALQAAPTARVVNVASMMAYGLDLRDVEFRTRRYDASSAYAQSKQANRMLTWALARRTAGGGITANAMHPGAVDTQLLHTLVPGLSGRSTQAGADTVVWLASSPEVAGVTGRFWSDRREHACQFRDPIAEEALWALCETMTA